MASAVRVVCNKEGDGNSNEGNGNKGGGRAMAMRAIAMVVRLAGNKEDKGKGSKGNIDGNVRVVGEKKDGK